MEAKERTKRSNTLLSSVVILGVLLLVSLAVMFLYINKHKKVNDDNITLQSQVAELNGKVADQTMQLNQCSEEIVILKDEIERTDEHHKAALKAKDNQIASLRSRSAQMTQLRERIAEYEEMEIEMEKLQNKFDMLYKEGKSKTDEINLLTEKLYNLQDSVEMSRTMFAYNIAPLTKWERWLWADRYNVSVARRVNETAITFEIAGTPFTLPGTRVVRLLMLDPYGNVMYPEGTFTDTDGSEIEYTQSEQVNYSGGYIPLSFTVSHPDKLAPGIYQIQIYIDGEHIRTSDVTFQ